MIVEGPFQNIKKIDTQGFRYYVTSVDEDAGQKFISIGDTQSGNTVNRQIAYTPGIDIGNTLARSMHSNGGLVAVSATFDDGGHGLVVHNEDLDLVSIYNTSIAPPIYGATESGNFLFSDGQNVILASLSLNTGGLNTIYSVSSYSITIDDSDFITPQGQSYTTTANIEPRFIAPQPNGGFVAVRRIVVYNDNGVLNETTGTQVFSGYVLTYFTGFGDQSQVQIKVYQNGPRTPVLRWNTDGAIRVGKSIYTDIVTTSFGTIYGENETSLLYRAIDQNITSPNVFEFYVNNGNVLVHSNEGSIFSGRRAEYFEMDFYTGDVVRQIGPEFIRQGSYTGMNYYRPLGQRFYNFFSITGFNRERITFFKLDRFDGTRSQNGVSPIPGSIVDAFPVIS